MTPIFPEKMKRPFPKAFSKPFLKSKIESDDSDEDSDFPKPFSIKKALKRKQFDVIEKLANEKELRFADIGKQCTQAMRLILI